MNELKPGGMQVFEVAGKKLVVEPVPYGNLKKLFKVIAEVAKEVTEGSDALAVIPQTVEKHLPEFLPLLFKKGSVDFLSMEWIDENLTMNDMKAIVDAAIKVNGLEDFFGKKGNLATLAAGANGGSTTSSASPTDGSPAK